MSHPTSSGRVLFADVSGSTDFCDTVGHRFIALKQSRSAATEFVEFFCE